MITPTPWPGIWPAPATNLPKPARPQPTIEQIREQEALRRNAGARAQEAIRQTRANGGVWPFPSNFYQW